MNIPSFLISDKVPVLSESTNNNIFKIAHVSNILLTKHVIANSLFFSVEHSDFPNLYHQLKYELN